MWPVGPSVVVVVVVAADTLLVGVAERKSPASSIVSPIVCKAVSTLLDHNVIFGG